MNSELEKLIDMVVADGQITEKERAFVIKKAIELGVDPDEAEIYLDGRLHQVNQTNQQTTPLEKKSNKEGDIKKCPACGSPVQSFNIKCGDCGHEFRNIETVNSVKLFFSKMNELESQRNEDTLTSSFSSAMSATAFGGESKVDRQKREMIANFPIPNSKEDFLEFLTLALPKAIESGSWFTKNFGQGAWEHRRHNQFAKVWKTKCEQIIMKARLSMKEDKKTLDEVEYYAKQLNTK